MTVVLDGESLSVAEVVAVAREGETVELADEARTAIRESRERVEDVAAGDEAVYGVNTGFGELVDQRIPPEKRRALQTNLVRSHASGAGTELPTEAVRAMLVTRVNALAKGHSGVREVVVDHLVTMLDEGVHPVVPSRGSLGASGDLAPLAHLSLVLIGEGEARVEPPSGTDGAREAVGERLDGAAALDRVGLDPLDLHAKEGLALVNGTQLTVGLAALLVHDAERLVTTADVAGALTTEVTMGSTVPAHPAISAVRPHDGQAASARNVRLLTDGSEIVESHRNCDRVQDAYSLRCLPQIHGAVRDAVAHLREAVETELNSATDNPLVFDRERIERNDADAAAAASGTDEAAVLSGGNFHGAPLALRLDYVTGALTDLAAIAERRVDRLLNPNVQEPHLPPFLAADPGVESGYMIAQYTAAALLSECRATGRPSTDSTPVSGNQEDHVSMSASSAFAARDVLDRIQTVVGIELLVASEAAEYVDDGLAPGPGTGAAYELVREHVPPLSGDRPLHDDVETAAALVAEGAVLDRAAEALDDPLA